VTVGLRQASVSSEELPESVFNYVIRTKQSVVLHDASGETPFARDEYIRRHHARSILCLPLLKQIRLVGVLYLENNLTHHVFMPARIAVLKLLASQAAISLENTRLYSDLQQREVSIRDIQMELAHANRVATMGQMSASIAHEVNQPVAAAITNAQAGLHWLDVQPPNIDEARQAFGRIVTAVNRASDVMGRIRAFLKSSPPQTNKVSLKEAIVDVMALTHGEVVKHGVLVHTELAEELPPIQGDRVQLQQVILNLIINAVEAMSGMSEGRRELLVKAAQTDSRGVIVTICDSGPGLALTNTERLFEAFYTTKPNGLGMGLSICNSIIEAHGGRLWATANVPQGAVFKFTLPACAGSGSS
jgi:C4-dicarboxylate-specific signal transduction histidine kinase